jgi:hypothetical protein
MDPAEESGTSARTQTACFLSYAMSDQLVADDVYAALTEMGVNVRTPADLQAGSDLGASISQAVLSAAFVCIVLSDMPPLPAVMFEAGIAVGSRRPLIIVATPEGANQIPVDLLSAPIIRHQPGSSDQLRASFEAYLTSVYPIAAKLTINWDVLVEGEQRPPEELGTISTERSLTRQISAHLEQVGALVSVDRRVSGGRIDLTATFPTLGDGFNPVLIEVKRRASDARSGLQQMRRYLSVTGSRLGMVLYGSGHIDPQTYVESGTGIILASIDEFTGRDGNSMVRELIKLRNQVVHSA